jgi:hypothetical protein
MNADNGTLVQVRCAWNAWRTAEAKLADLREVHWEQPSGAPRPLLHAYVDCTELVSGDIPHDCGAGKGPHRLLVCVLKRYAAPQVYTELVERAERQLQSRLVSSLLAPGAPSRRDGWGTAHVATPNRGSSHI